MSQFMRVRQFFGLDNNRDFWWQLFFDECVRLSRCLIDVMGANSKAGMKNHKGMQNLQIPDLHLCKHIADCVPAEITVPAHFTPN